METCIDQGQSGEGCVVAGWVRSAACAGRDQETLSWLRAIRVVAGGLSQPLASLEQHTARIVDRNACLHDDHRHGRTPQPAGMLLSPPLQIDADPDLAHLHQLQQDCRVRARTAALSAGLLIAAPGSEAADRSSDDLLTELGRQTIASAVGSGTTSRALLALLADYDRFDGISIELFAWELDLATHQVAAAWFAALTRRWADFACIDPRTGEDLYRLTEAGWAAHGCYQHPASR